MFYIQSTRKLFGWSEHEFWRATPRKMDMMLAAHERLAGAAKEKKDDVPVYRYIDDIPQHLR
ncbi:MAG TPA: hypothetical protein VFF56_05120 [Bacillota bacterium]|nr:hypothetical protein [Bacillota bacterium]